MTNLLRSRGVRVGAASIALTGVALGTAMPMANAERTNPNTPYEFGVVVHKDGAPKQGIPIIQKLSGFDKPAGIDGSGNTSFCIEMGAFFPSKNTPVVKQADLDGQERLAYIVNKYGDDRDDLNQAAVQMVVHQHLDVHKTPGMDKWISDDTRTEAVYDQYLKALNTAHTSKPSGADAFGMLDKSSDLKPSISHMKKAKALADDYWAESKEATGDYTASKPKIDVDHGGGTITGINIKNGSGKNVSGKTKVTVTLSGKATFSDGSKKQTVTLADARKGLDYVSDGGKFTVDYSASMPSNKLHVAQMGALNDPGNANDGRPTQTAISVLPDKLKVQADAVPGENPDTKIGTTAKDKADGDKYVAQTGGTVIDTVKYEGLLPGKEYTVSGELMDKATGKSLGITASKTFTPTKADGSVDIEFKVGEKQAGKTIVAFEKVKQDGREVATHTDIKDKDQTVYVSDLSTTALDKDSGEKNLTSSGAVVVDTVAYKNVAPGKEYTVTGKLVDKDTGKPIQDKDGKDVTASKTFTPKKSDGKVAVEFPALDGAHQGKTLVAFETLQDDKGKTVAHHEDASDEDQTTYVTGIGTKAWDKADKDKSVAWKDGVVVDEISYQNLVPGKEYTASGTLMDKATGKELKDADGNPVTAEKKFTPEKASGTVKVEFKLPDTAEGKKLVAFEDMLNAKGDVVGSHKDIDDKDQSVDVSKIRTKAFDKSDKDKTVAFDGNLVDTVKYENLVPGQKYTVTGELMDKSTGEAIVDDETGEPVTAEKTFTAEKADGSVDVEFDLNRVQDRQIVVYETLTNKDGKVQAEHKDLSDAEQSVRTTSPEVPPETPQPPAPGEPGPQGPAGNDGANGADAGNNGAAVNTGGSVIDDGSGAKTAAGIGGLAALLGGGGLAGVLLRRRHMKAAGSGEDTSIQE